MVNGISSSYLPYNGYPANATGATQVTKDIASYCYDTQRPSISKTYGYLTSEHKPDYKWPVIGSIVAALSFVGVRLIKRG